MIKKDNLLTMLPLFLVIAIDSMGLGVIFPTLSSMIINTQSHFLPASSTMFYREFVFAVIVSVFMIAWFFGAAILGDLSDMIGRKKSLAICLLGAAIGYFISAMGIEFDSITLLIAGRLVAGFTAGSQAIAQAAIVDLSSDENRARNIGYMLLISSIGFVVGPFLGGVLSDTQLVSWFHFSTPLYFSCLMSLLNVGLLFGLFKETFTQTRRIQIRLGLAVSIFKEAFAHPKIRKLSLVLFIFIAGWSAYFSFIPQFLIRNYQYSSMQVALFMTVMACGFGIGFGVVVDLLSKRFSIQKSVCVNLIAAGVMTLFTIINRHLVLNWFFAIVIGLCVATAYSMIVTLCSQQASDDEQGWVMGITNSIMALAFGLSTLFGGLIASFGAAIPLMVMIVGMFLAAALIGFS